MSWSAIRRRYFGDRAFYKMVLAIAIPIVIQSAITNFVSLLDNIMVGQIGTEQMSGVAIVNQLMFVFNLCIFGGMSGAGIFTAQYCGKKDDDGIRYTFRFKVITALVVVGTALVILGFFGDPLIRQFLTDDGVTDPTASLHWSRVYLQIILWSIPGFAILQLYASTLRECGETFVPMVAGITAVFVNLTLNYVLIYGKFGFPCLGVAGAAIATVVARYVEVTIVICYTHLHRGKYAWIQHAYRSLHVPAGLTKQILIKGMPLLLNEALWSSGQAILLQCYSTRGLMVVAGMNIANTVNNLFNIFFLSMGNAVAIILGQHLGAGRTEEARDHCRKLLTFSVLICVAIGTLQSICAPYFPRLYNTTDGVRALASSFLIIYAVFMPLSGFLHSTYFALRSGGKSWMTFLFDSGYSFVVSVPVALFLSRCTEVSATQMMFILFSCEWIKVIVGYTMLKKGVWVHRIVD